jgi:thiol-disulfide isomerase/thioredoxin
MRRFFIYLFMHIKLVTLLVFFLIIQKSSAQNIQVLKFDALKQCLYNKTDTVYVVNFFASWCKPCIQEIPEFVTFDRGIKNSKTKLVFVSLDSKNEEEKLLKIVQQYSLQNVYLLDESNANNWINKIDKHWSGAIPATLIIKKGKHKKFIADSISSQILFKLTK